MRITMIGTGYVGLVSGACFADFGADVVCVDVDVEKIKALQAGRVPIYEPGLEVLVERNMREGRLRFVSAMEEAVPGADVVFIAVGTPARRGDGYADLCYVYAAAREVAKHLDGYAVIVTKSTVPVGTARQVARIIAEEAPEADFDVASNPEFLREGDAVRDFMQPDRVVIGVESPRAGRVLRRLYQPLHAAGVPILTTNLESAELIKYASNAFLATKVSFINEISALCEKTGADVMAVAEGMGMDKRIGADFLRPGPGYGGSCFPKDTLALVRAAQEHGVSMRIVEAAMEANVAQKMRMVKKIVDALDGNVAGKTIGVLGLTFKPGTDDMREAPSLTILPLLVERGARIQAHDPKGMEAAKRLLPEGVVYCGDPYEVALEADALVLMTEWNEYYELDFQRLGRLMRQKVLIDLRNIYDPEDVQERGYKYVGVGRK